VKNSELFPIRQAVCCWLSKKLINKI
ncbi:MAG: hypothetical protein RLZZ196_2860, partial [Bacteroidota bacterium]